MLYSTSDGIILSHLEILGATMETLTFVVLLIVVVYTLAKAWDYGKQGLSLWETLRKPLVFLPALYVLVGPFFYEPIDVSTYVRTGVMIGAVLFWYYLGKEKGKKSDTTSRPFVTVTVTKETQETKKGDGTPTSS